MHRTYVRRRAAAVLAVLVLTVGLTGPVARALDTSDPQPSVPTRTYVVRRGDTLWSIASSAAPARDPREVIDRIRAANPGSAATIWPGQVLAIPPLD